MKFKRALAISLSRPNSRSSADVHYPPHARSLLSAAAKGMKRATRRYISRRGDGKLRSLSTTIDAREFALSRDSGLRNKINGAWRASRERSRTLCVSLFLLPSLSLTSSFPLAARARDFCLSNSTLRSPRRVLALYVRVPAYRVFTVIGAFAAILSLLENWSNFYPIGIRFCRTDRRTRDYVGNAIDPRSDGVRNAGILAATGNTGFR